jgi:hypothetical protein
MGAINLLEVDRIDKASWAEQHVLRHVKTHVDLTALSQQYATIQVMEIFDPVEREAIECVMGLLYSILEENPDWKE